MTDAEKLRDTVACLLLALYLVDNDEELAAYLANDRECLDSEYARKYWREIQTAEHHCDAPITCDACVRDEFLAKADKFIAEMYP